MSERTADSDLKEIGRCQSLKPTESDFINKKGYERKYREDGSYEWRYNFTPNDGHGRLTKEAQEVGEMMKPFAKADTERAARFYGWPGEYGTANKGKTVLVARGNRLYRVTAEGLVECSGDREV